MAIGRRQLLTSIALTALATPVLARGTATRAAAAASTTAATDSGPLVMHVVAHEDDDILFMNPDLSNAIANRTPSVTVFVTAGNATGDPCASTCWDTAGEPLRTWNRQMGAVNAYSRMAGVGDDDPATDEIGHWTVEAWTVAGKQVERYVLNDRPVHLVFLNLHDAGLAAVLAGGTDTTVVPKGSPLSGPSTYTAADVVEVLRQIMVTYRPTVLRAQDELPDSRYWPDHPDHVAAAKFAGQAASQYGDTLIQVNHRDYNIGDSPVNLDPGTADAKGAYVSEYVSHDHTGNFQAAWFSRMYYRWSRGTSWAGLNQDGRPQVFVVRAGALHTYWRRANGSWGGATRLADPGGRLAPGIAVGTNADGRLEVFARRLTDHHIVSVPQTTPNGLWRDSWADLGNPSAGLGNADQVGVPVVAASQDGRLELFVKNGGGGLSTIRQTIPGGAWTTTWDDLHGTDLQDPVAAIRNGAGRIEVFAATRNEILNWSQTAPDDDAYGGPAPVPDARPASPPRAALDQDGRIELAYREVGTGAMLVSYQTRPGGPWSQPPANLGGDAGVGEPATTTLGGRVVLFERNRGGGVSTTAQTAPNSAYGPWQDLGGTVLDHPAAIVDGDGLLHLFAIGTDGLVHYRTGTTPTTFGPWQDLPL
ncbi:PIG-L family deacetylase [Streptomyces sp. NRRL WC-3742]|uniref:PIG-L family deacetylase n=1 Tax=Streptomyces sp. NRRL WC-3742 TaxID=1463934 RepID=UPI0004C951FC|nr:PIG-L family deacetylase [Streptomyces sp. NRRL WC-3742]